MNTLCLHIFAILPFLTPLLKFIKKVCPFFAALVQNIKDFELILPFPAKLGCSRATKKASASLSRPKTLKDRMMRVMRK